MFKWSDSVIYSYLLLYTKSIFTSDFMEKKYLCIRAICLYGLGFVLDKTEN